MKKILSLLLVMALVLGLCACGNTGNDADTESDTESVTKAPETETEITVSVCASAFDGKDSSDISAFIKEHGFDSFTENEDGTVTIKMSNAAKDTAVEYFKGNIDLALETARNDNHGEGELFESVISVSCNEDYSEINYSIDKDTYNYWMILYEEVYKQNVAWYQALCGIAPEDVALVVRYTYAGEKVPFYESEKDFTKRAPKEGSEQEESENDSTAVQVIQDGDKIVIEDYCEFTVIGWDSVDEITRNGMKMLTGTTNENNTIIRLTLDYTNTSKEEQKLRNDTKHVKDGDLLQAATLTYDKDYNYVGGCGSWSDLIPLTRDDVYIFFNVPKTVLESDKSIDMEFKILDKVFKYTVR